MDALQGLMEEQRDLMKNVAGGLNGLTSVLEKFVAQQTAPKLERVGTQYQREQQQDPFAGTLGGAAAPEQPAQRRQSAARRVFTQDPNFSGIPGLGTLMPSKVFSAEVEQWQGPMLLNSGERVVLQAKMIATAEDPHWEVQILDPSTPNGWTLLDELRLEPFGESRLGQRIISQYAGEMVVYKAVTRASAVYPEGTVCLRFRQIDAAAQQGGTKHRVL